LWEHFYLLISFFFCSEVSALSWEGFN
jgi:hypothetical protein